MKIDLLQSSNVDLDQDLHWDVIVIGAGPAGSLAAMNAAKNGLKTLLVESKSFPRPKVCGGCLNERALQVLDEAGLLDRLRQGGGLRVARLRLACGGLSSDWKLKSMLSISRLAMDPLLVQAAIEVGAKFSSQTTAMVEQELVEECRLVRVHRVDRPAVTLFAKVVVVASGLTSNSLNLLDMKSEVAADTRIGVGTLLEAGWNQGTDLHQLTMAVGKNGYVGLARVESRRLNVAAAVDSKELKRVGSIPKLISEILSECKVPIPDGIDQADWQGTPALTRKRSKVSAQRLIVLGDSAGYIEPFTGEGMTWGLQSAALSADLIREGCQAWSVSIESRWEGIFREEIRSRQWICRGLSQLLRKPSLAKMVLRCARCAPWIADKVIAKITGSGNKIASLASFEAGEQPIESHA